MVFLCEIGGARWWWEKRSEAEFGIVRAQYVYLEPHTPDKRLSFESDGQSQLICIVSFSFISLEWKVKSSVLASLR